MKKLISLLTAMIFSMVLLMASAESFSVRGNVDFSTTQDEIIRIEEGYGNVGEMSPTSNDYYTENCILYSGITFANIDDCNVIYYFNNDNELVSILYELAWAEDKETAIEQYNTLNSALELKYGKAIFSNGKYLTINTDVGANDVIDYETSNRFNGDIGAGEDSWEKSVSPMYLEQRLIALDNGYVDIKITLFNYTFKAIMHMGDVDIPIITEYYPMAISYTYCTEEHMQAVNEEIQNAKAALDSDL